MKRAVLGLLGGAALLLSTVGASVAEDASADKTMADRYVEAAQGGDATAQFYLGALYSAGVGRPQSDIEAFRWFSRAAENGNAHAALILGGLYTIGRGTPKDNFNGYKWASVAAAETQVTEFRNGANQLMSALETRLTTNEVRRAKIEAERQLASNRTPQTSTKADGDSPRASAAPPVTSARPRASSEDSSKPAQQTEAAADKKQKNDFDDFLNMVPSGIRKKMGF